jgi:hypothetical protein
MIINAIIFGLALFFSMCWIGKLIEFYVQGMNRVNCELQIRFVFIPSFFWALFYYLTH